jgi:hypothetical protein
MKSTFKLFVIIAVIAAIGFSMAACDDGTTSGGGGSGGGGSGTLTLTDIPAEYNGKYVNLTMTRPLDNTPILGVESIGGDYNTVWTLPQIRDGKVAIKLWAPSHFDGLKTIYRRYSETETISAGIVGGYNAIIIIYENQIFDYYTDNSSLAGIGISDAITFTKGSATVSAARCRIDTY